MRVETPSNLGAKPRDARAGFTIVELMIVIAIIALLLGLLLPVLSNTMGAARSIKCQMGLRSVSFDFSVFADDQLHGNRGNDVINLPKNHFLIETFQDSQYGIAEFWAYGSQQTVLMPDAQGHDPMRCPTVKGTLQLRKNVPCSQGGVAPWQYVSYGFNMRLEVSDKLAAEGLPSYIQLTSNILLGGPGAAPNAIPLAWDVDGLQAAKIGSVPVYSAPSLGSTLLFANNRFWYPGLRHNGALNIAFIDGRVDSTRSPLSMHDCAWGYDPVP